MPSRLETDRRIESALSLFVVAVVLGLVGELAADVGQAMTWWLIRSRGWTTGQVQLFHLGWSWASALQLAGRFALIVGLWRLSRSLAGGRARRLATGALWVTVFSFLVATAQQLVWTASRGWDRRAIELAFTIIALANLVLILVGAGLWLAAVVAVARTTSDGARRRWAGPVVLAAAAVLVDAGFAFFGAPQLIQWPALGIAAGVVVTALHGAGLFAVLSPARRAFRTALDGSDAPADGPYRSAGVPGTAWRSAAELTLAGAGLVEVRRRVGQLGILLLAALPSYFVIAQNPGSPVVGWAGVVLGAIQLAFTVPMVGGVARYTRAPFELTGRSLGMGALGCMTAAVVLSVRSLVLLTAQQLGWEPLMSSVAGDSVAGSCAWLIGTALLLGSLARAARGLGDLEVRRRAFIVVGTYLGCVGLTVVAVFVALTNLFVGNDGAAPLLLVSFLLALVCILVYRWLLDGAAKMLSAGAGSA